MLTGEIGINTLISLGGFNRVRRAVGEYELRAASPPLFPMVKPTPDISARGTLSQGNPPAVPAARASDVQARSSPLPTTMTETGNQGLGGSTLLTVDGTLTMSMESLNLGSKDDVLGSDSCQSILIDDGRKNLDDPTSIPVRTPVSALPLTTVKPDAHQGTIGDRWSV